MVPCDEQLIVPYRNIGKYFVTCWHWTCLANLRDTFRIGQYCRRWWGVGVEPLEGFVLEYPSTAVARQQPHDLFSHPRWIDCAVCLLGERSTTELAAQLEIHYGWKAVNPQQFWRNACRELRKLDPVCDLFSDWLNFSSRYPFCDSLSRPDFFVCFNAHPLTIWLVFTTLSRTEASAQWLVTSWLVPSVRLAWYICLAWSRRVTLHAFHTFQKTDAFQGLI